MGCCDRRGKVVALWDVNACTMKQTLNRGTVNALMLNTRGWLLPETAARKVTTWGLPRGDRVKELTLDGWVKSVVFLEDGNILAAAGATAAIHLWDAWNCGWRPRAGEREHGECPRLRRGSGNSRERWDGQEGARVGHGIG